jgi:glycosyltransferase involved in cell wall biosynthesis
VSSSGVTIGIPVYNGADHLAESLGSALAQTVPADHIVVWDNASTDDSLRLARSMLPADCVMTSERNLGAAANFDRAARAATTEWFMWLAADDRIDPRFVEECLRAAEQATGPVSAVLTGVRHIDAHGDQVRTQVQHDLGSASLATRARAFARTPLWTEVYCLYRRTALMASPGFTPEYGTDVLLTWWFILRGPLLVVDSVLFDYRETPERTVEEMAESLLGGTDPHPYWRKARVFRRLWAMAGADDLTLRTTWTARRHLLLTLLTSAGALHLREDVEIRAVAIDQDSSTRWRPVRRLGLAVTRGLLTVRESISLRREGTSERGDLTP